MLKLVTIPITEDIQWFEQIKRVSPIPSRVIIDKTLPGLGATWAELKAPRNSILIMPNVATILDKDEHHKEDNTYAMIEGSSQDDLRAYLNTPSPFKKILTTPESFMRKVKPVLGTSMYLDYFMLVDESHKVISDVGYRDEIVLPMDDFFKFRRKAMISATTLLPSDKRFEQYGFKWLKLEPTYDYRKEITVIHTNNVIQQFLEYLRDRPSQNYCIFFNSIQGIKSLIETMTKQFGEEEVTGNCKIYCSKESVDNLKADGCSYAYRKFDKQCLKYNFFTSSFFNGLDIKPEVPADVVMITDVKYADYTVIEPSTDAWQIQGRFRNQENSLTHIVNTDAKLYYLEQGEIKQRIKESESFYRYVEDFKHNTTTNFGHDLYVELLSRVKPYASLLNPDKTLNQYKVDNYYYNERIKSNYTTFLKVKEAYEATPHFKATFAENIYKVHGLEGLKYGKGKYSPENYRTVTDTLASLPYDPFDYDIQRIEDHLYQHFEIIVRAYYTIGIEIMMQLCYDHELISKALIYTESLLGRNRHAIIDAVQATFRVGQWYPLSLIKKEIREIYNTYDLNVAAKALEIEYYFKAKQRYRTINKTRVKGFEILEANQIGRYNRR